MPILTLFRMGFFGAVHGWGGDLSHVSTMMKLGRVTSYPRKTQKYINHVTHHLSSVGVSIFSPEISKFYYIKKCRYRLDFDT